ncbi:MAG TPA: hypothetical protein VFE53_11385 [Mucilaginibacter sp.]|jgi:hypothetical protein|nr:hypothetical protein [Mucilaginibacter sp.]
MRLLKTYTKTLLITLTIFIGLQSRSYADGGFPVRPGRLLLAPSVSYFFANSAWDTTGTPAKRYPNNGKYSSVGVTFYGEYGISRKFAAVLSLPYVYNSFTASNITSNPSSGLTDMETGIRYYLANIDFIYYFSLQGTAVTPLYHNDRSLGYGEEGGELKLAVSGSGNLFDRSIYFNASDGFRQYFGSNGPWQNRYTGTFGITIDKEYQNQVSVTGSGILSRSTDKTFSPVLEANKDYSFFELSLNYGHTFTDEISVFATAGKFLTGYNTSAGTLFSLAFIYRLDYK